MEKINVYLVKWTSNKQLRVCLIYSAFINPVIWVCLSCLLKRVLLTSESASAKHTSPPVRTSLRLTRRLNAVVQPS